MEEREGFYFKTESAQKDCQDYGLQRLHDPQIDPLKSAGGE
jgi:hypothetical protein